jgi:hypothetical protein
MPESLSRRKFISYLGAELFLTYGLSWGACSPKKSVQENSSNGKPNDPCSDYSGVSESELDKRNKFGYARQAPTPDKQCNLCKLYLPLKKDEKCGGCMLFKGPVDANGSCTYWAPLV